MPLYDYRCQREECLHIQKDVFAKSDDRLIDCVKCGDIAERLVSATKGFIFRAGYYEHVAADPIYCGSKADLRCVTRDNNCTSDYAE